METGLLISRIRLYISELLLICAGFAGLAVTAAAPTLVSQGLGEMLPNYFTFYTVGRHNEPDSHLNSDIRKAASRVKYPAAIIIEYRVPGGLTLGEGKPYFYSKSKESSDAESSRGMEPCRDRHSSSVSSADKALGI